MVYRDTLGLLVMLLGSGSDTGSKTLHIGIETLRNFEYADISRHAGYVGIA
jgi:hypothetical protein